MEFSGEDFSLLDMTIIDNPSPVSTKSKGGRPTVPDNFLLGSRNRWLSFFEECWPDVGWPLLQIRRRRSSTIADVQRIFEPIKEKQRCELAAAFLGDLPDMSVSAQQLIRQRTESSKLRFQIQDMQTELAELERSLREASNVLRLSTGEDRVTIAAELRGRAQLLWKNKQIELPLKRRDCDKREAQVCAGETYIYCSELLDFLRSGRRALKPTNLAGALAGLPDMRWRQSDARCSKLHEKQRYPLYPYAMFLTIERLCKRVSGIRGQSPVDSFRAELDKLLQSTSRNSLCNQWRDFRLAIEEVYSANHEAGFIPYALTAAFLRNTSRLKTPRDTVLDIAEAFVPQKGTTKRKIRV
jgi:hypothetical protein